MIKPISHMLFALAIAAALGPAIAQPVPDVLPFEVIIGDQIATHSEKHEHIGIIAEPVQNSAEVTLPDSDGQVIVNAFPSDASGDTLPAAQAKVLLFDADDSGRLDQTIDGSKLASGYHLLNIMVGGKTARVLIRVR